MSRDGSFVRRINERLQDRRKAIVGSAEQVAARLRELAKSLELDELVVVTWTYDLAPRRHSYELLAESFGLGNSRLTNGKPRLQAKRRLT
jgi:alkanesulfonate monooxygenase SsuD/methylene tetrahydromethanopterin reductase-like flavin-dependent oxidoreductase (luciferase family)